MTFSRYITDTQITFAMALAFWCSVLDAYAKAHQSAVLINNVARYALIIRITREMNYMKACRLFSEGPFKLNTILIDSTFTTRE